MAKYIPNKNDLLKLKESKGVPVLAHSHETIVPVVYSSLVNNFLKSKGIKLPLTHQQLKDFKDKAKKLEGHPKLEEFAKGGLVGMIGKDPVLMPYVREQPFAKGGNINVGHRFNKKIHVGHNIHINYAPRRRRKVSKGNPLTGKLSTQTLLKNPIGVANMVGKPSLYDTLRPNNYAMIRPLMTSGFTQPPIIPDYKREAEEHLKREREALAKYKKEIEEKQIDSVKQLEEKKKEIAIEKAPLVEPNFELLRPKEEEVQEQQIAESAEIPEEKEDVPSEPKPKKSKVIKAGFISYDMLPAGKRFNIESDDPKVVIMDIYYNAGSSGAADPISYYQMGYNLDKKGKIKSYKVYKSDGSPENYANYVNVDLRPRFKAMCDDHFQEQGGIEV